MTPLKTCILCAPTQKYIDPLGRCLDCSKENKCSRCDLNPPDDCSACSNAYTLFQSRCFRTETLELSKAIFNIEKERFELAFPVLLNRKILELESSNLFSISVKAGSKNQTSVNLTISELSIIESSNKSSSTLNIGVDRPSVPFLKGTALIAVDQPSFINQTEKEYVQVIGLR